MKSTLIDYESQKKDYDYKFSIITAVYNTAIYLEEMIESVINQDIGFEENIQVIFIDDGSSDGSQEVLKRYQFQYPRNIVIENTLHEGVSCARNKGLKHIKGKYVNFLDSDDRLDKDVLTKVEDFFLKAYEDIDLVAIPLYFFDQQEGEHILNYKFYNTRVIDISKEINSIVLSSSSCFIKSNIINEYYFDKELQYGEDAKFITQIILRKGKYGVINDAKYFYRKRKERTSAIQNGDRKKEWYLDYIKYFSLDILSWEVKKEFESYIQNLIIYDLQWRINNFKNAYLILSEIEFNKFIKLISEVVKNISFKYIINQKNIAIDKKILLVILKNDFKYSNKIIKLILKKHFKKENRIV